MSRYDKPKAGEKVYPNMTGYKMACCDCGLVHKIIFGIEDARVVMQVYRDNRATAQIRRHMRNP